MSKLSDAMFTETRQKMLGLLYGRPERRFYTPEICRLTGLGAATIQHELKRMLDAGILTMTRIGNQHHFQANHSCPIFEELSAIVKKTMGSDELIEDQELLVIALSRMDEESIKVSLDQLSLGSRR